MLEPGPADSELSDQRLEQWADELPFPAAVALWAYVSDHDERARFESIIHFFEITARLLGMILLSGLRADPALFASARPSWQGNKVPPSVTMGRPTLGSWVRFHADLAKATRRAIQVDPESVRRAFKVERVDRLSGLASRSLGVALAEAVRRRNDWRGHDAAVTTVERRRRVSAMADLACEVQTSLASTFRGWHMIEPGPSVRHGASHLVVGRVLLGPNRRFKRREMELLNALDADRLYFHELRAKEALEIVPWIRIIRPIARDDAATYVYDRMADDGIRWVSYDAEDPPEFVETDRATIELSLLELDLPIPGVGQTDPSPPRGPVAAAPDAEHDLQPVPTPGVVGGRRGSDIDGRSRVGVPWATSATSAICSALLRARPTLSFNRTGDTTSIGEQTPAGWIQAWPHSLLVTAHVPIELAPQFAGLVVSEVPVTAGAQPGVRITIEDDSGSLRAVALLIGAITLQEDRALGGDEYKDMASLALADEPDVGWGSGDWPATQWSPSELRMIWDRVGAALPQGLRPITDRPARSRASIQLTGSPRIQVRADARSLYVVVVLHDREKSGLAQHMLNQRERFERSLGFQTAWHRRVDSLLIIDRACDLVAGQLTDEGVAKISAHVTAVARELGTMVA